MHTQSSMQVGQRLITGHLPGRDATTGWVALALPVSPPGERVARNPRVSITKRMRTMSGLSNNNSECRWKARILPQLAVLSLLTSVSPGVAQDQAELVRQWRNELTVVRHHDRDVVDALTCLIAFESDDQVRDLALQQLGRYRKFSDVVFPILREHLSWAAPGERLGEAAWDRYPAASALVELGGVGRTLAIGTLQVPPALTERELLLLAHVLVEIDGDEEVVLLRLMLELERSVWLVGGTESEIRRLRDDQLRRLISLLLRDDFRTLPIAQALHNRDSDATEVAEPNQVVRFERATQAAGRLGAFLQRTRDDLLKERPNAAERTAKFQALKALIESDLEGDQKLRAVALVELSQFGDDPEAIRLLLNDLTFSVPFRGSIAPPLDFYSAGKSLARIGGRARDQILAALTNEFTEHELRVLGHVLLSIDGDASIAVFRLSREIERNEDSARPVAERQTRDRQLRYLADLLMQPNVRFAPIEPREPR